MAEKGYDFTSKKTVYRYGIKEDGVYTFTLTINNKTSDMSDELNYKKPAQDIAIPTNLKCSESGELTWDAVENATIYTISIACTGGVTARKFSEENKVDISEYLSKECRIVVAAISVSPAMYGDSDYSEELVIGGENTDQPEESKDKTPTDLTWDERGQITFKHNLPESVTDGQSYDIQIRNNDTGSITIRSGYFHIAQDEAMKPYFGLSFNDHLDYDFSQKETQVSNPGFSVSGKYQVRFRVFDGTYDKDFKTGIVSDWSPEFNYVKPSATLDVPQNLRWVSDGVLTWDDVDGACGYEVRISSDSNSYYAYYDGSANGISIDLHDELEGKEGARVVVHSLTSDYTKILDSDFSKEITYQPTSLPPPPTQTRNLRLTQTPHQHQTLLLPRIPSREITLVPQMLVAVLLQVMVVLPHPQQQRL